MPRATTLIFIASLVCSTDRVHAQARAATTTPTAASDVALNVFKNDALSLSYPKSWTRPAIRPSPMLPFVVFPGTTKNTPGNLAEMIALVVSQAGLAGEDLKSFGEQLVAADKKEYQNVTIIEEKDTQIGGLPARRILIGYEREGEKLRKLYLFTIKDSKAYTFFYNGDVGEFDRWQAEMEKVVDSVKWASAKGNQTTTAPASNAASVLDVKVTLPTTTNAAPDATSAKSYDGWAELTSKSVGLRLQFPATWQAEKNERAIIGEFLTAYPMGKTPVNKRPLVVHGEVRKTNPKLNTAKLVIEQNLLQNKSSGKNFQKLEDSDVEINGVTAYRAVEQHEYNGVTLKTAYVGIVHDDKTYVLRLVGEADAVGKVLQDFDKIMTTIAWTK